MFHHVLLRLWLKNRVVLTAILVAAAGILLIPDQQTTIDGGDVIRSDKANSSVHTLEVDVRRSVDRFSIFVVSYTVAGTDSGEAEILEGIRLLEVAIGFLTERERLVAESRQTLAGRGQTPHSLAVTTRDPAPDPAARLKNSAAAIAVLQRSRFEPLERAAAQLLESARDIRTDLPLSFQRDAVATFFVYASDLVRGMAEMKA